MTPLEILKHPDPRLQLHAETVTAFDDSLSELIDGLLETQSATEALGFSAPQVNDRRKVLVIAPTNDADAPKVYVNPEILSKTGWGFVQESCLSVPGIVGSVLRSMQVRVRAQDRRGRTFEGELRAMDAVCLQHEMDHLVGKLFIDRLSIFRRLHLRARANAKARRAGKAA